MDIREVQRRAWDNKIAKGFNMTDVALEFGLLTAEIGEAFTAWRKHLPEFGEELADVAIYLASIAQMNGIDLADEVERKLAINDTVPTAATITAAASEHDQPLRTASRRLAAPRRLGLTMPLIAVTGHMNLTPLRQKLVRTGFTNCWPRHRDGLTGITCLAKGADQIFARAVLDLGRTLVVVRPTADYRERKLDLRDPPCSTSC